MKQEIKELWTTALRSGEYKQGRGKLHWRNDPNEYCCLGVLCVLAAAAEVCTAVNLFECVAYDGEINYLPESVQQWAGLGSKNPIIDGASLSILNDGEGDIENGTDYRGYRRSSFTEIADAIERGL